MSACDSMAALNFHNSLEVILCQFMIFLEQTFKLKKKHRKIFNVLAIAAFAHQWLFINRLYIQQ